MNGSTQEARETSWKQLSWTSKKHSIRYGTPALCTSLAYVVSNPPFWHGSQLTQHIASWEFRLSPHFHSHTASQHEFHKVLTLARFSSLFSSMIFLLQSQLQHHCMQTMHDYTQSFQLQDLMLANAFSKMESCLLPRGPQAGKTVSAPKNSRHADWYLLRRLHRNWIHPGKPASRIRSKPQTSRPRHLVWPHIGWTPQRYNVTRLPEARSSKTDVKIPATKYDCQALPILRTALLWVREPCLARCHSSLCCPKSRAPTGKHGKGHPMRRVDHSEERTPRRTAMVLVTMATCNRLSYAVSPPEKLTNSSCVLVSPRSIC